MNPTMNGRKPRFYHQKLQIKPDDASVPQQPVNTGSGAIQDATTETSAVKDAGGVGGAAAGEQTDAARKHIWSNICDSKQDTCCSS